MDLSVVMQHAAPGSSLQGPSAPQKLIAAVVLNDVTVPDQPIRCKDTSTGLEFVATSWNLNGGALPAAGDRAHLMQSSDGVYTCVTYGVGVLPSAGSGGTSSMPQVVSVNVTTTLAAGDTVALVTGSAPVQLSASPSSGRMHTVKDAGGTAGVTPIVVTASGGALIDGATSVSIDTAWSSLSFITNGTNWFRI